MTPSAVTVKCNPCACIVSSGFIYVWEWFCSQRNGVALLEEGFVILPFPRLGCYLVFGAQALGTMILVLLCFWSQSLCEYYIHCHFCVCFIIISVTYRASSPLKCSSFLFSYHLALSICYCSEDFNFFFTIGGESIVKVDHLLRTFRIVK